MPLQFWCLIGLRLDDESVRIVIGLWIGAPLCFPYVWSVGLWPSWFELHREQCRAITQGTMPWTASSAERLLLAPIDVPSILEPPGLFRSDGKHVDGVTIIPWEKGRALMLDVTCRDTYAPSCTSRIRSCCQERRLQEAEVWGNLPCLHLCSHCGGNLRSLWVWGQGFLQTSRAFVQI